MDNFEQNKSELQETGAQAELSHSDKMTGVFTEPSETFQKTSLFPPRVVDWLLPVAILFLIISITRILVFTNEEISYAQKQKQNEQMEKTIDDMVKSGQLSREQAEQQKEVARKGAEFMSGPVGYVLQTVSIFLFGFIFFFVIVTIYFLFARVAFKGEGTYKSALVANGLPAYISILQVIIAAILSMAFDRLIVDTSAASLMGADKLSLTGFLLGKLDPISIWVYAVASIGLAKMFRSSSTGKYYILVFGLWIIGSFLLWLVARSVPFLRGLVDM